MDQMMGVLSYSIGTIIGFILVAWLCIAIIHDVTQKQHTVLRNFGSPDTVMSGNITRILWLHHHELG